MRKKISILVISDKVCNFTISHFTARTLLVVFICIVGGVVWVIFQYGNIVNKDLKIRTLKRENHEMREKYNKLQQFEKEFNEFKQRLLKIANALGVKEGTVIHPKVFFSPKDSLPSISFATKHEEKEPNSIVEQGGEVPSIFPVKGWITQHFSTSHPGVDFAAELGTSVVSTITGDVEFVGEHPTFGKIVEIVNKKGFKTVYSHLARTTVVEGTRVKQGNLIGYVGSTGKSSAPHLHYEIKFRGIPHDPERYLPK